MTVGVDQLPSGKWRFRIEWKGRVISASFPTEEEAGQTREACLRRLIDGDMVYVGPGAVRGIRPIRKWPQEAGVYFCAVPGVDEVKVGSAQNIARRMRDHRCTAPRISLLAYEPGGRSVEFALHRRFSALRVHGEWFRLDGELLDHIHDLRGGAAKR